MLFEKGKLFPWIVDCNGWFWGDGRVYDVLFGKEPVEQAELGLSYDTMLKIKEKQKNQVAFNLKQELGPAWEMQGVMARMFQEDVQSVLALRNGDKKKSIGDGSTSTKVPEKKE